MHARRPGPAGSAPRSRASVHVHPLAAHIRVCRRALTRRSVGFRVANRGGYPCGAPGAVSLRRFGRIVVHPIGVSYRRIRIGRPFGAAQRHHGAEPSGFAVVTGAASVAACRRRRGGRSSRLASAGSPRSSTPACRPPGTGPGWRRIRALLRRSGALVGALRAGGGSNRSSCTTITSAEQHRRRGDRVVQSV